jgi:hypothetical protein
MQTRNSPDGVARSGAVAEQGLHTLHILSRHEIKKRRPAVRIFQMRIPRVMLALQQNVQSLARFQTITKKTEEEKAKNTKNKQREQKILLVIRSLPLDEELSGRLHSAPELRQRRPIQQQSDRESN